MPTPVSTVTPSIHNQKDLRIEVFYYPNRGPFSGWTDNLRTESVRDGECRGLLSLPTTQGFTPDCW